MDLKKSAKTRERMAMSFMTMLSAGPEVSLRGSPTVSPTTAALWSSGGRAQGDGSCGGEHLARATEERLELSGVVTGEGRHGGTRHLASRHFFLLSGRRVALARRRGDVVPVGKFRRNNFSRDVGATNQRASRIWTHRWRSRTTGDSC